MMVTFVSQCEKKALNRTRRVLDAFADRIGDNTWQTVITQEGLLAVKKLLRKTATKNTAVSCHWIRSRSRSELVWVVGSRDKFNMEGIVPVNSTQKEVPMDIARDKPIKGVDYANTHLQRLDHHLFAVGYVAEQLYTRFYPDRKTISDAAFIAGCLHDLGKIDPNFQAWAIKDKNKSYVAEDGQHIDEVKFSFEKHPRHNEISVLLYELLDDISLKSINITNKKQVKHTIYWHHAKPFRVKGGFESLGDVYKKLDLSLKGAAWGQVVSRSIALLDRVSELDCQYRGYSQSPLTSVYLTEIDKDKIAYIQGLPVPEYKSYELNELVSDYKNQADKNAVSNQLRACLITADRWISALSAYDLSSLIKQKNLDGFIDNQFDLNGLSPDSILDVYITECLNSFPDDERGRQQSNVAEKLAGNRERVGVLAGAAGCGKTKIALEWAKLSGAKQILWICPRVQICQGLFAELIASDTPYLPNANIELHTGEFKCINSYANKTDEKECFSGDVVITTIDQLLNTVISHTKADQLLHYLSAHIVFDEYHEYINMPAFNLLFAELVASRKDLVNGCNTILVSATPHYLYLEELLDLDRGYDVVEMPSFNQCKYKFSFVPYDESSQDDSNPLYKNQVEGTFVISNTALTAQKSFIHNQHSEVAVLLHSKYKKSDKQRLFESVYESFRRDGTREYDVLRSGPIVQASLNISCENMISEICHAENNLQRLGRLDRFGMNTTGINDYTVAIPDSIHAGKRQGSSARFMSSNNVLSSTIAWYEFLTAKTDDGKIVFTLPEIYGIYSDFYQNEASVKFLREDLIASMKKSAGLIANKASEPKVIVKPKRGTNQRAKISKNSLRGDTRFVQMAVCDVTDVLNPLPRDEYAYDIPSSESDAVDNLTESLDRIKNSGLLDYAAQKHGRIEEASVIKGVPANKMTIRKTLLESYARDPEYPIFLSYTPSELDQKLGEHTVHAEAVYYGVCEKQPIGAISIKHLTNRKD
jgi:CRISPR-associated endonuclease/helicase Cas3